MAELELKLNREEVNSIVRQWVEEHYPSLKIEDMTITFGTNGAGFEFGDDELPVFKGYKVQLNSKVDK
ncbi:hypothetical protein PP657_gp098 [Bacillus phage BCPST]|uniref:Uncharacterized protein n=1 Tax=Bacillus phage BCPST TaxID=2801506 RepID=A0AAE7PD66_9CAUD|nr:hypothetical protein PP657_gp098 [Bacillus phage BCPST]QQO38724.1 hypothetical protein BCPST_106 [Bacillus phage BCPST]QSJ04311.1 hypothetical protein BCP6_107 [Bacillus phage BCP6]